MRMINRTLAILLLLFVAAPFVFAGEEQAEAVDSTVTSIKKGTKGEIRADGDAGLVFKGKEADLTVPFDKVTKLQYGLKEHMTIGYSVLTGIHPKKAKAYLLTVAFTDGSAAEQTIVFKLAKNKIWTTLINLQTKTGKKVEFDDEKSRKEAMKDAPPGQVL